MNNIQNYTANQTPIEIALGIDKEGRTTAKKLYEFLEMDKSQYARWCKNNILENQFAEVDIDYWVYDSNVENLQGGRPSQDFKLSAKFAKKLSMTQKNEKGELARNYFVGVEDTMKLVAKSKQSKPKKKNLSSVNMTAKILQGVYKEAGVDPLYIAVAVDNLYKKEAGIDFGVPLISKQDKLYDYTTIAKELGVVSESGNPHDKAISAIVQKLDILDEYIVKTPYSRNGHDGVTIQYTQKVFDMVKQWLIDNNYPSIIEYMLSNGKINKCKVFYQNMEVA